MQTLGDAILAARNWDNFRDAVRAFLQHPDVQRQRPILLRDVLGGIAEQTTPMTEAEVAMSQSHLTEMGLPHTTTGGRKRTRRRRRGGAKKTRRVRH